MQILDKYGYLESALDYIEKQIISGKGLQKIAKKTGVSEDLLKNLSLALKGFSQKQFFAALQEEIESRHSSVSGADVEIVTADISIETPKKSVFILLDLIFHIVIDGEKEDKIEMEIKIFSKNNIQII
ncbi:MAG: hypothetical protein NT026_00705 [Candidatus Staskawiczbacteria bacterium]|nr:hypothetical protein [Candidatus Staskawiczbacteria bacterium]